MSDADDDFMCDADDEDYDLVFNQLIKKNIKFVNKNGL